MFHSHQFERISSFKRLGFSARVWRCLERAERGHEALLPANHEEISLALAAARQKLDIAADATIRRVLDKNPLAIRLCRPKRGSENEAGLLALLPLNQAGFDAVMDGLFSGLDPDPDWVCAPDEEPEAVYVWLVHMPGTFGRCLGAIGLTFDSIMAEPKPLFSRATNRHSVRLHQQAGFMQARSFFPQCNADLQVVFPEQPIQSADRNAITVRIARTVEDIFKVFSVRSATYIAEQFCFYDEEFDGNDFCSTQILGEMGGDAAGCVRLRFFGDFAKLERLAVRREYRTSRLAYRLVRDALEHCRKKGYTKVYGHSRLDLVRFWKVFGFKPIEGRPAFTFANVRYVEILAELEPHPAAIRIGLDPMAMIRPEGVWDRPGPFDMALSDSDPRRKGLLAESTRTLGKQDIVAA
jgi:predicted GNAT family N-acyltransferase